MKTEAHGVVWWLECALGTGGVLVRHHDPANRVWKQFTAQYCNALARSTGVAINQGQETATQHDCGAFGTELLFPPPEASA